MEVAFIHYTSPPREIAGVERVIEFHTRYLIEEDYIVHLVYGRGGGFNEKRVVEHKLPYLDPLNHLVTKVQREILKERRRIQSFVSLKEEVKKTLVQIMEKVDCCVVHNIPSMPFNFAATSAINELAEEIDKKFLFWLHDGAIFRERWKPYIGKFPFTLLNRYIPKVKYVTPSDFRARQFKNAPLPYRIPEITVVPNGVDITEFGKMDEETLQLYYKFGIDLDDVILICPVRITPRKNLEYAIQVTYELNNILNRWKRAILLVLGPPEHIVRDTRKSYFDYLRKLVQKLKIKDKVFFCYKNVDTRRIYNREGKIVKWSISDVYMIADAVLVPSLEEGFGLPLIEAGAARKPVFCSSIPPFREIIRHDVEGYTFDPQNDAENVARKIYEHLAHDYASSNFKNVLKKFTWDAVIKNVKQILEE